jgi:hypothetical protein
VRDILWPVFVASIMFYLGPGLVLASDSRPQVTQLKNLYIETVITDYKTAKSVIVTPAGSRYADDVNRLQSAIKALSGITLPVLADTEDLPKDLLKTRNVIAIGNMNTNKLIERLYREWYVILDLKYPGPGGYVVRSLHNPYGTGHNVIFLGGSDDAGVTNATEAFLKELRPGHSLKTGWLMVIKLSTSLKLPDITAYMREWRVYSWQDSWRKTPAGQKVGYPPATFFGWNPISIAGVLFYMTGEKRYLECFKETAMPDVMHPPAVNRSSDAFDDPADPIVKSYHYRAHLLDCVWDLIEESPAFSDNERLFITNKLLQHQAALDPTDDYSAPNGDRHATYHMLSIYTGSRYFSKYYPEDRWNKRIENVRKGFCSFLDNPTWGEWDTLNWVSTSIEPIFEFFILDGLEELARHGTARTMMRALEILTTGDGNEEYHSCTTISLLLRAAYILRDGSYVWILRQLGFDLNVFRIGQSYWPAPDLEIVPPRDLSEKPSVLSVARADLVGSPVSASEAFQLLAYRTGLDKSDDYLLLDGFEGLGRHPYQLATILKLRMFGGVDVLSGYANDVTVRRNGMAESHVPRSAALKNSISLDGVAYFRTEVPDMPGSRWLRHIFYLRNQATVVLDRIIPRESGRFDVTCYWQLGAAAKNMGRSTRAIRAGNGAAIVSADSSLEQLSGTIVRERMSRDLDEGESLTIANLLHNSIRPKDIKPLGGGGYLITGSETAFIGIGPYHSAALSIEADFVYADRGMVFLVGAKKLSLQGEDVVLSEKPVTLLWRLANSTVTISALQTTQLSLSLGESIHVSTIPANKQVALKVTPRHVLLERILNVLDRVEQPSAGSTRVGSEAERPGFEWKPEWTIDLKGRITALTSASRGGTDDIWAVSQNRQAASIARITDSGKVVANTQQIGEALSVWSARSRKQASAFTLLVGFKDDTLRAFAAEGSELWRAETSIHPSFFIGDHYDAPWFTDPHPPNNMTGVHSILVTDFWGTGQEEIAIGRPCTVEFRTLDGSLKGRTPTRWGTNAALAVLRDAGSAKLEPLLLVGKSYTGNPVLSGINRNYQNISDSLFGRIADGSSNMHAWLQRGLSSLITTDIDGDGKEEVIYTLSGHWNELRVYDASGRPLWMKFFGPDKIEASTPFMRAMEIVDLNGDGIKEIIVGTKEGWVHAFDHRGNNLWQRRLASGVTSLATNEGLHTVAVGCEDGTIMLIDRNGKAPRIGTMGSEVRSIIFDADGVIAGSAKGQVKKYPGLPKE